MSEIRTVRAIDVTDETISADPSCKSIRPLPRAPDENNSNKTQRQKKQ